MSHPASLNPPPVSQSTDDDEFPVIYWKRRFDIRHPSPHPVIATLDIEYNELAKSWKRLQELLPLPDQVLFEERPQTSQDVLVLVHEIQALWASGPQKQLFSCSMTLCDAFSATLDAHTTLLVILPNHQFYSSLLHGTLQSIIKAYSRYPRIIRGVMKALVKVNRSICLSRKSEAVQFTNDLIPSIASFYSHVFFFLGELMDWYARRFKCRLLQSLHEDVYLDFYNLVSSIQTAATGFMYGDSDPGEANDSDCERANAILQHTDLYLWEEARLSQIGRRNIDRRFAAQNALTRLLIWEIQRSAKQRLNLREKRGQLLVQMFDAASQRLRPIGSQNNARVCLTTASGQDLLVAATLSEKHKHKYSRVELQLASAHLQDYFDDDNQTVSYEPSMDITVDEHVVESLKQWATDTYSQILAIGSSPDTSPVALVSACYASLAQDAQIPVVTYFCSLPPTTMNGMTLFQQGLIALVYSLIRQLLEYLPPVVNGTSAHVVKAENFTLLDGTLTSWKEILSLIDTLLYYAPPLLLCVVDGLDRLQDPSTVEYIRSLVRILVSHTRIPSGSTPGQQSVVLKILFTVAGRLEPLAETLSENPLTLSESNAIERTAPNTPLCSDVEPTMGA
ncbi:hypothetical protein BDW62DRAFT_192921 [Aspergillus aurantiobrunneus]